MGDEDSSFKSLSIMIVAILIFALVYLGYVAYTSNVTGYVVATAKEINASLLGVLATATFMFAVFIYFRKKRRN